jgi:hypothetical protein
MTMCIQSNALTLLGALGLAMLTHAERTPPPAQNARFIVDEATVSSIHAALSARTVTCVEVVQAHLRRIESYDTRGPALNAIITINPRALETAADFDRAGTRSARRPLHCIPLILKDNFDTGDMPTTGGSLTFARSVPLRDAFVVKKLREAGAIVLAKANMTELALGGNTVSSLGGQTKNPYDLTRAPVRSLDELFARGEFHPSIRASLEAELRAARDDVEYTNRLLRRQDLRQAVMTRSRRTSWTRCSIRINVAWSSPSVRNRSSATVSSRTAPDFQQSRFPVGSRLPPTLRRSECQWGSSCWGLSGASQH